MQHNFSHYWINAPSWNYNVIVQFWTFYWNGFLRGGLQLKIPQKKLNNHSRTSLRKRNWVTRIKNLQNGTSCQAENSAGLEEWQLLGYAMLRQVPQNRQEGYSPAHLWVSTGSVIAIECAGNCLFFMQASLLTSHESSCTTVNAAHQLCARFHKLLILRAKET